jgi:hypothetical protein
MCQIARRLLAEKLIDDFYNECVSVRTQRNAESFMERLKAVLPTEQHEVLDRFEEDYAERCEAELRQLAEYVAGVMMSAGRHEKDGEMPSCLDHEVKCTW